MTRINLVEVILAAERSHCAIVMVTGLVVVSLVWRTITCVARRFEHLPKIGSVARPWICSVIEQL